MLRKKGYRVFAKTTGDAPVVHNPDGSQKVLKRFAPASIIENVRLIYAWAKHSPDVLIMECMALQPEIQHALAGSIFKPTHTIITNIFADHHEVMGQKFSENIRSIGRCIQSATKLICSKETETQLAANNVQIKDKIIYREYKSPLQNTNIPPEIMIHSWSIVREMAAHLDIRQSDAIECFIDTWTSLNSTIEYFVPEKNITFWNLYSVNDIHTAQQYLAYLLKKYPDGSRVIFNLNCRNDRPLRTRSFIDLLSDHHPNIEIWLTGSGRMLAKKLCHKKKESGNPLKILSTNNMIEMLGTGFTDSGIIFGLGNKHGTDKIFKALVQMSTTDREA
jgi:poly-gamma-glutamate synthase PgsB/CapB